MDDKTAIEVLAGLAHGTDRVFPDEAQACELGYRAIEALAKLRAAADEVRYGRPSDNALLDAMYVVLDELDAADGTTATDDANVADMRREYNRKYGLGE